MTTTATEADLAAYLDPARKHDFTFVFDVRDGNPNGDPDAGGMPRVDPETMQGLVTDVAIKRKIRNTVALLGEGKPGFDIYVEAGVALNAQHKRAYADLGLKEATASPRATGRPGGPGTGPAVDVPDLLRRAHVRGRHVNRNRAVRPGARTGPAQLLPFGGPGARPGTRPDPSHPDARGRHRQGREHRNGQ